MSPSQNEARMRRVLVAWRHLAPEARFGGESVEGLAAALEPAFSAREALERLRMEERGLIAARIEADRVALAAVRRAILGIKGDPAFGETSALYRAMGFKTPSERRTGRVPRRPRRRAGIDAAGRGRVGAG